MLEGVKRSIGSGWPASWLGGWSGGSFQSLAAALRFGAGEAEQLVDPVSQHVWVYACVRARARALSSTPLKFWLGAGDDAPELTSGPLVDLFNRPHPLVTGRRLWQLTSVFFDAWGQCHWLLYDAASERRVPLDADLNDPVRTPVEIVPVPGPYLKAECDNDTGLPVRYHYSRGAGRQAEVFPPGAVVTFSDITNGSLLSAIGATTALKRRLTADFAAETLDITAAQNGGMPSMVFSSNEDMTELTLEQMREEIDRWISAPDRHQKPALLSGGLTMSNSAFTPKDMENAAMREWSRDAIMAVFGVTKPILGITDDVNRANAREAKAVFWEETIIPQQELFLSQLTDGFLRRLVDVRQPLVASFDMSGVEALGESLDDKIARTIALREEGIPFEQRAALAGWDIDPSVLETASGNVEEESSASPDATLNGAQVQQLSAIIQNVALGVLPKEAAVQLIVAAYPFDEPRARKILASVIEGASAPEPEPAPAPAPAPQVPPPTPDRAAPRRLGLHRRLSSTERRSAAEGYAAYLEPRERELVRLVEPVQRAFIDATMTKVRQVASGQRAWRPRNGEVRALEDDVPQAVLDELARVILPDTDNWAGRLGEQVGPALASFYFEAAKDLAFNYGWDIVVPDTDTRALTYLATKQIELGDQAMGSLADNVRDTIARTMFENGGEYTIDEIAGRLASMLDETGEALDSIDTVARAERIARTEVSAVVNAARRQEMQEAGIEQHQWVTANDGEVRASHGRNDGAIVAIGDAFPNGMTEPHQEGASASEVVNCRCHLVPIDPLIETLLDEFESEA